MKKHSAFSLIEISVVILIIGILVAGVTQGSRLMKLSRLNAARSLTQSSPVAGIKDLMLWYETSLESSFDVAEQTDGSVVSTWYDNSPQSPIKNNATQSTAASKPFFKEAILNGGIPTVRFDGANDLMSFDGTGLVGTDYTIFVVEQKLAAVTVANSGFFGGSVSANNSNLWLGYIETDTQVKLSHYGGAYSEITTDVIASLAYSSPGTPRIHTGRLSTSDGMSYWLNGGTTPEKSVSTENTTLGSYVGAALGRAYTNSANKWFNGDLAEIIIFTRALKTEERQAVEAYLGKKYGTAIS